MLARVAAWLVVLLYVAGMVADGWLTSRTQVRSEFSLGDLMLVSGFGAYALVGALLVAKRPGNLVGWIMAAIALMVALFPAGDAYAGYVMSTRGHPDALAVLGAWVQSWYWYPLIALALIYLPLLFPDGRLISRRWLLVAVPSGIGVLGAVVLGALTQTLTGQDIDYKIENPTGIEGLAQVESLPIFGAMIFLFAIGNLGGIASLVVRFRRSRGVERQQMKWFLYAAAPIPSFIVSDYLPWGLGDIVFGLVIIALPTAIGIAVLRYRLYEIDLIINRTLVYGALTASLALVYFGSVVGLQRLLSPVVGAGNQLAIVGSTLLIAALFNPLRRRLQSFIDRRFYRRKYDAARTLADFSARLREETDLERLSGHLVDVVWETMQPEHASLWLREMPQRERR